MNAPVVPSSARRPCVVSPDDSRRGSARTRSLNDTASPRGHSAAETPISVSDPSAQSALNAIHDGHALPKPSRSDHRNAGDAPNLVIRCSRPTFSPSSARNASTSPVNSPSQRLPVSTCHATASTVVIHNGTSDISIWAAYTRGSMGSPPASACTTIAAP